ncbi:MAG: hypothetical protein PVSMB4_05100 [Ktedonobacterales bacterium]
MRLGDEAAAAPGAGWECTSPHAFWEHQRPGIRGIARSTGELAALGKKDRTWARGA